MTAAADTLSAPVARTVQEFCKAYGIGKSKAYEEMAAGNLLKVKVGKRTLIDEESAREWYRRKSGK